MEDGVCVSDAHIKPTVSIPKLRMFTDAGEVRGDGECGEREEVVQSSTAGVEPEAISLCLFVDKEEI